MTGIPQIPNSLKRDTWKRQKSIIAQVFKPETGIGKALDAVATAYAAVEWQYFDPHYMGPMPKPRTIEDLDDRLEASHDKRAQIDALIDDVEAARDLCRGVGNKWERSNIVPKSSRIYVQQTMPTDCDAFIHALNNIGTAGYDIVRDEIERVEKMANGMLKGWVKDLGAAIPKVKADPTVDKYEELMHQNVRGMGTALSKIPRYKALYLESWQDMADASFVEDMKDGKPVSAKVKLVEAALNKLKLAMKKG